MRRVVIIGLSSSLAVLTVSGGLGFWYWHIHQAAAQPLASAVSSSGSSIPLSNNQAVSSTGQPLLQSNLGAQSNNASASAGPSGNSSAVSSDQFKQYDQYKSAKNALFGDVKMGTGAEVVTGKQLVINYRGWLTNGQEFDESYSRGQPFVFTVGQHQVIIGLEEGVIGMKVGGTRLVIVPPIVGYGDQTKGAVPGGSVMVFQIELVAVQ